MNVMTDCYSGSDPCENFFVNIKDVYWIGDQQVDTDLFNADNFSSTILQLAGQ